MADPTNNHPHVDPNANSPIARLYRLLNGPGFSCSSNRAPLVFASGGHGAASATGSGLTNNNDRGSAPNNDASSEARLRGGYGGSDIADEEKNEEERSEYLEPIPQRASLFVHLVEILKELELQKENDHARSHPYETVTHRYGTQNRTALPKEIASTLEAILEEVRPYTPSSTGTLDSTGDTNDEAPPEYEPTSRLRGGGNWLSSEQVSSARQGHSQPSPRLEIQHHPPSASSSSYSTPFVAVEREQLAHEVQERKGGTTTRNTHTNSPASPADPQQQQHSTIVPLRNFPLPVPAVLRDSLVVQLPRSFCRQVHGRVRMAVDAWAAGDEGRTVTPSSPSSPSLPPLLPLPPSPPLWSECFGEMSPREVAAHGREYERRRGAGRFQGPYWVKDREGRVRAVERDGERRELARRWFGEQEDSGDEAVLGRLRGGDDDDDDENDDNEGYSNSHKPLVRDDQNDWRIFKTPALPRPADDYPPNSRIPRWLRRRPHATIVPMPDFVLGPGFRGFRRVYMSVDFGPKKLGIGGQHDPPKLKITEPPAPWEEVFPSWSPSELADLQRGWEKFRYGWYSGPYWNCDERGNVRVVETRREREELMEAWFGKGNGKAKQPLGMEARLRGGGHFDEGDDSGSDQWEDQDNDGFTPPGSDGSSVRSTRGSSSSEEPAAGDRPFTRSKLQDAEWDTEIRRLLDAGIFGKSFWHEEDKEIPLPHQHQTRDGFESEAGHSCQKCGKSLIDEAIRGLQQTSIIRIFRSSLQEFQGELPSRYEVWRAFRSWPEAWLSNGEFNRELWEVISRELERSRMSRRHEGDRADYGWLRGGGRFSRSSSSGSEKRRHHRHRRHRRAEEGNIPAGDSDHHGSGEGVDLPYDLSTHFRESLASDGNTVDMPLWAMLGAMEEWSIGEETFRPSSAGDPKKDPGKRSSGEEDERGSSGGSGSDWEEYWGNLGPKRIPVHVADRHGNSRSADLRRALRLLREAERARTEHTGGSHEDVEERYDGIIRERVRQALHQRLQERTTRQP